MYSDSQAACAALAERWGYACRRGEVRLQRYQDPVYPVIGSFAQVETGLPRIRYLLDPERPALQGTRKVE